jgi:hypothetical protein
VPVSSCKANTVGATNSTDKAAINAPAPKAAKIEINCGLGFVRRATREPMGKETALRAPRDVAQMRNFKDEYSMTTCLSVSF